MISTIKQAILSQFKKTSPLRSIEEGLVKFDFQIQTQQQSLMQICFSPLASWLSALLMLIAMFSPFRYDFTLVKVLGFDHSIILFLMQSSFRAECIIFIVAFFLGRVVRFDFIAIFILAWLLGNGDIHIVLAQAGLLGILFSQIRWQLTWYGQTQGVVKKVINWIILLQFVGFFIFIPLSWLMLANVRASGLFDQSMRAYRLEYLLVAYLVYQALIFSILGIWGHFYIRIKPDPSVWNLKYSVVMLMPRFFLNSSFQKVFEAKVRELWIERQKNESNLSPDDPVFKIIPHKLREMQKQETEFLTLAKKMIE